MANELITSDIEDKAFVICGKPTLSYLLAIT